MQPDDEIKKKLTGMFRDFEAEPREESWEKIRASVQLSRLFQDFEAEPQDDTWEKIRAGIELPQLMSAYEPEPQEESWEKIRAGLDLAQKFKNYEAEPQEISWLKIQEAIHTKKRRRGIIVPFYFRVGIAAGLVMLLGSLWWLLNSRDGSDMTAVNSGTKTTVPQSAIKKPTERDSSKKNQSSEKSSDTKAGNSANDNLAARMKTDKGGVSNTGANATNQPGERTNKGNLNKETFIAQNKTKIQDSGTKPPVSKVENNANAYNEANVLAQTDTETAEQYRPEQLSSKGFQQKTIRKPFSAIAYNAEKPIMERAQRVYRKTILTASLMPLQTYQAFTILPQTNTYIQQVGRLDAIDNQRLGIQVRAGAMQPLSDRFSVGVSATYTGVQQWANYEINDGDYEVQTADNGSYTLVGIGEQVVQKQFMQTIGVKVDNSYLISKKKTSIYGIAGAEAVHVLNNKDFGYYVNASVGFSYPVKGGKSLWIEPTFRYSLSQSLDANNYLKIRPYNIGLNLRINFI
jgi:hypothetical protein